MGITTNDDVFDMEDVAGLIESLTETCASEQVVASQGPQTEEQIFEEICGRLAQATSNAWICVPRMDRETGIMRVETASVANCSKELFFDWVNHIYPCAKTLNHKPEDYEKESVRRDSQVAIVQLMRCLQLPATKIRQNKQWKN